MPTIQYLAFGGRGFFDEVLFSILTLQNAAPETTGHIVVYTDKPDFFARVPGVKTVSISRQCLKGWLASFGYVYRAKILALADCMDRFGGNVVLLDGDTFFTGSPSATLAKISPECALMNQPDPGRRCLPACRRVIDAAQCLWNELGIPNASDNWRTWNSGVVGLHESHRPFLEQILYVNDVLYTHSGIRTVEQIATSIVLQNHVKLEAMDLELQHYFWAKKDFSPRLSAFMDENRDKPFEELLRLASAFRPELRRDPAPRGTAKWRNSYNKRASVIRFRLSHFLRKTEWASDTESSRQRALLHCGESSVNSCAIWRKKPQQASSHSFTDRTNPAS